MPVRKARDDTAAVAAADRYLALEAPGGLKDLLNINQRGKVLRFTLRFQVKVTNPPEKKRKELKISNYSIAALGHGGRRRQEVDPSVLFLASLNSDIQG